MSICISYTCPMYQSCARAYSNDSTQDSVDYMNQLSGSNNNMKTSIDYACGPFGGYRLYETIEPNIVTVNIPNNKVTYPPTRQCSICNKWEYPGAEIIKEEFWICPECCKKINDIINADISKSVLDGIMRIHE